MQSVDARNIFRLPIATGSRFDGFDLWEVSMRGRSLRFGFEPTTDLVIPFFLSLAPVVAVFFLVLVFVVVLGRLLGLFLSLLLLVFVLDFLDFLVSQFFLLLGRFRLGVYHRRSEAFVIEVTDTDIKEILSTETDHGEYS